MKKLFKFNLLFITLLTGFNIYSVNKVQPRQLLAKALAAKNKVKNVKRLKILKAKSKLIAFKIKALKRKAKSYNKTKNRSQMAKNKIKVKALIVKNKIVAVKKSLNKVVKKVSCNLKSKRSQLTRDSNDFTTKFKEKYN